MLKVFERIHLFLTPTLKLARGNGQSWWLRIFQTKQRTGLGHTRFSSEKLW